jgi:tetratricopeptide (TPR) repeat protein
MTEQTHWSDRQRRQPNLETAGASQAANAGVGPNAGGIPGPGALAATATSTAGPNGAGFEAEQVRLDAAMQRADDLLVDSLRRDEDRRRRRRRVLAMLIIGALIMTAIICVLLAALAGQSENNKAGDKPDDAKVEQAEALTREGWQLWQQRKMAEAEAKFAEAVKIDATNANAFNGLGWSRFNQGKAKEAIEPFEKAVALEADHPAALNGLGQIYLHQGKLENAEKFLMKAAAHDASAAWFGLARLYLVKGDYDRALPWALLVSKEPGADPMAGEMLTAARNRKIEDSLKKKIQPAKK